MLKKIWLLILIIFIFLLFSYHKKINFEESYTQYQKYVPVNVAKYPSPFLLYSKITPAYLLDNAELFKSYNFQGFIIGSLPSNWYSSVVELKKYSNDCKKINKLFNHNYLRIILTDKDLPEWQDEEAWVSVNNNIRKIVIFARDTGFKGVLLDTTAYNREIWNPAYYKRLYPAKRL